jgi:oligosaccharyltransferase complex subunit beta
VEALTGWCFQETKVLRVTKVGHRKVDDGKDGKQLEVYRIKDEIIYEIQIEEFKMDGKWVPFELPSKEDALQLEIVMLDPYIRTNLDRKKAGEFAKQIKLPDVYGVFTFKMVYHRHGYSFLTEKSTVSIVPFRHNEYPRFLVAAYPYYASAFSMIVSFYIFTIVYLYVQESPKATTDKKKN